MAQRYFGIWKLLPQASKYDVGQPPLRATYSFTPTNDNPPKIDVNISWTDIHNKDISTDYQINLDGHRHTENLYGTTVQVEHSLNQKGILKSIAYNESGEKILMQSWRELKEADTILQVVMETPTEKGVNRIYQKYEKV